MSRIEGSPHSVPFTCSDDVSCAGGAASTQASSAATCSSAPPTGPTANSVVAFFCPGPIANLVDAGPDAAPHTILSGATLAATGFLGAVIESMLEATPLGQFMMGGQAQQGHAPAPGGADAKPSAVATNAPGVDPSKKKPAAEGNHDAPAPASPPQKKDPSTATSTSKPPATPRTFPKAADGTPKFAQGDAAWGNEKLKEKHTFAAAGCAVTASAMALSKVTGQVHTPRDLDAQLDAKQGYAAGENMVWSTAASAFGAKVDVAKLDLDTLGAALEAGDAAVLSVSGSGGDTTEHWVTLTSRDATNPNRFHGVDPATGEEVCFEKNADGRLESAANAPNRTHHYLSTGDVRTFSKP